MKRLRGLTGFFFGRAFFVFSALVFLAGCASSGGKVNGLILDEYRLEKPTRQFGHPLWLASFTSDEIFGRLSPDGRQLVYASDQKGSLDIWIKDLTSGIPRRITDDVSVDTQPNWSPDQNKLVFVSMRQDVKGDLYLVDLAKKNQLTRLTNRDTADAYPVFAPDGSSIFFAAGPEGQSRIEQLDLASKRRLPITDWGATHPAISPDGQWLAFTYFDEQNRGRLALMRLADRQMRLLTSPDYHCGFPTFTPDGRRLIFSRFYHGQPYRPLNTDEKASLWSIEAQAAFAAADAAAANKLAHPLTSGRFSALFTLAHPAGLVFTSHRAGSLDIGLLPLEGLIPRLAKPEEQLALALRQSDADDRLLALLFVESLGPSSAASQALHLAAMQYRERQEFDKAIALLKRLAQEGPARHGNFAYRAQIDLTLLFLEQKHVRNDNKLSPISAEELQSTSKQLLSLTLPTPTSASLSAHRLLRQADIERLANHTAEALKLYQSLPQNYASERDICAEALFRAGELMQFLGDEAALADYFLSLADRYPDQPLWLKRGADAALAIYRRDDNFAPDEIDHLRRLIDRYPRHRAFVIAARFRLAKIYEKRGDKILALQVLSLLANTRHLSHDQIGDQQATAAFELGRLALVLSDELRAQGRHGEAMDYYRQALAAYEKIMTDYEPAAESYQRARSEYLRLAILEATQLEQQGEFILAQKRYARMLQLLPDLILAHRKLMQFRVRQGHDAERRVLESEYQARLRKNKNDFVGNYALAFLDTWRTPLDESALKDAAAHLERAIEINPQSPFGHLTLGWVNEMRERFLGQTGRGWLEEAIVNYERAANLVDVRLDPQTYADILLNQCNVFAALGNGWRQAYEFCQQREKLNVSFLSTTSEAQYHLTFGRAAAATGHYDVSAKQLEQARELAGSLKQPMLQAQIAARQGLTAHLAKEYERSNQFFAEAQKLFTEADHLEMLAGLHRSQAFNYARLGKREEAIKSLKASQQALEKHGTVKIESFSAVGGPGRSTSPYGFDKIDEDYVAWSLETEFHQQIGGLPEIEKLLLWRRDNRAAALKKREDPELKREIILLENRLAFTEFQLGDTDKMRQALARARQAATLLQTEEKTGYEPTADTFPLETALALSEAEETLYRLDAAQPVSAEEIQKTLTVLLQIETQRKKYFERENVELLPQRIRLALWHDLALLYYQAFRLQAELPSFSKPINAAVTAEQTLKEILHNGDGLTQAISLLRLIVKETSPAAIASLLEAEVEQSPVDRGVLASLYQPLSHRDLLRRHLNAGINLAQIASLLTPTQKLANHATTTFLDDLLTLAHKNQFNVLPFVIAAQLAERRSDLKEMKKIVADFLAMSPLLLGNSYLGQAAMIRQMIFRRAINLALAKNDTAAVLSFAEQQERRQFLDDLLSLPPAGAEGAAPLLNRVLAATKTYQKHLATFSPLFTDEEFAAWKKQRTATEEQVARELAPLGVKFSRVKSLLEVPAFPLTEIAKSLDKTQIAISAVIASEAVYLIKVNPSAALSLTRLPFSLSQLRQKLTTNFAAANRELAQIISPLIQSASLVYLDLGRIDARLGLENYLPPNTLVVRLATLWEILDAQAVRNFSKAQGLVLGTEQKLAPQLSNHLASSGEIEKISRSLEEAGVLVFYRNLRFDGRSSAAVRLLLNKASPNRLSDWLLGRNLGLPLRGRLLVVVDPQHTPQQERAQIVALTRLIHAAGIPSLLVINGASEQQLPLALKKILDEISQKQLALLTKPQKNFALYGDSGLEAKAAQAFARASLEKNVQSGAAAFNARRLPEAIEKLHLALRAGEFLGEEKYLDGTLLFLANSYTLLEDFPRAVPFMERLITLRKNAIALANKKGQGLAEAQAKLVQALQSMGWLRMRNKQYDLALAANQQAIDLYLAVKRPLLAQPVYDQRSSIAEKKGDLPLALTFAQKSLDTARENLVTAPKDLSKLSTVAATASRLARLYRTRFSNFRQALFYAQMALDHLPQAQGSRLSTLEEKISNLKKILAATPKDKIAPLTKQLTATENEKKTIVANLEERTNAMLEIARVHSARGSYRRAVSQAEQALALVQQSQLPLQDTPLLEIVNNLYYLGDFKRALAEADRGLKIVAQNELRQIQFHNAKGSVFAALGRTAEALQSLEEALRLARKLDNAAEMAASYNNLGNAMRLAGRFAEAQDKFLAAQRIDQKQNDRLGLAFDLANLGLTEELLNRPERAQKNLQAALSLSRELGAPLNELKATAGLGRLALRRQDTKTALTLIAQGQQTAKRLGLRQWSWRFHLLAGRALRAQRQIEAAQKELRAGLAIIESQPPRLRRALGSPQLEEEPEDLYDEMITLLAEQGQAEAAFDLQERQRQRALLDLDSQHALEISDEQTQDALNHLVELQAEIEAARASALLARTAEERAAVSAELTRAQQLAQNISQSIQSRHPRLLENFVFSPRTLAQLKMQLATRPNYTLLSYFVGQQKIILWQLQQSQLTMHLLDIRRDNLEKLIADLRTALTRFHEDKTIAAQLYRTLLPAKLNLKKNSRLVIIPSGPLHLLPFAALYDQQDYLVARHAISYLPSLGSLPFFEENLSRAKTATFRPRANQPLTIAWTKAMEKDAPPLSFANRESRALQDVFTSAIVLEGDGATRQKFLEQAASANLIHVATHATNRQDAPWRSSLLFSDGELPMSEIITQKFSGAPLVILSACETGLGRLDSGDSVISLHRAFLAAGAPRLISSLWRVSDLGSALLMKKYFRELKSGSDPAVALQAAQNILRTRFAHPAYWAAFRLDGAL